MRLLVVDDEPPARERLVRMVAELDDWEVAGEAGDGVAALAMIPRTAPDAVLLDVRMPRMDGIEAARHLATLTTPRAVVFTTAYDEYALAAFDANAVAYLLKPVRAERLADALARAQRPTRAQLGAIEARAPRRHLAARIGERRELVPVERVRCFVADSKYVVARHPAGELLLDETLKDIEREFGERLLRVHRNALVAVDHVERLDTHDGAGRVHLRGDPQPLEVSRRHLADVRRRLRG
jgi:two-component system, LytTR family, response regulator AlgR